MTPFVPPVREHGRTSLLWFLEGAPRTVSQCDGVPRPRRTPGHLSRRAGRQRPACFGAPSMPTWSPAAFALGFAAAALTAQASGPVDHARAVLAAYVARSQAFDASLADLYADRAFIENQRSYPNGTVRRLTIPAADYKTLIRQAMPLAKQQGDTNRFTDPRFTPEGSRVRIEVTRHSELK